MTGSASAPPAPPAPADGQHERRVLAAALYAARFSPVWQNSPYWLLRRCVAPYVATDQFLVLQRDGLPVAFAGWACERPDRAAPWRQDRFLPSAPMIEGPGECVVTECISGFLAPLEIVGYVARYLKLPMLPAWIERGAERKIIDIHPPGAGSRA